MAKAIEITLHDPKAEKPKTYTRSIVPWGVLKRSLRVVKNTNFDDPSEEDLDEMASLVVSAFGDQFSLADVDAGMDIEDMVAFLENIVGRALRSVAGQKGNPTPAASSRTKRR